MLAACQTAIRLNSTQHEYSGQIIRNGNVECFTEEFMKAQTKPPRCEISAVEFIDKKFIFGSDKDIPSKSSIFSFTSSISFPSGLPEAFLTSPKILNATKFEAMAKIREDSITLASTGFDRTKPDGSWDRFNNLLAWRASDPDKVQVILTEPREDAKSSVELRDIFRAALKQAEYPMGPPYFKVEGMAYLPGGIILFGVRETGARYDDFQYHRWILAGKLRGQFPTLTLGPQLKTILDFSALKTPGISESLGISSIAFDPIRDGIWILTSYETEATDEGLGAYLWFISRSELLNDSDIPPQLIRTPSGVPLHFAHKSEGLAVLEDGRLFVVHDDDRVTGRKVVEDSRRQFSRKLNESFYSVVEVSKISPQ